MESSLGGKARKGYSLPSRERMQKPGEKKTREGNARKMYIRNTFSGKSRLWKKKEDVSVRLWSAADGSCAKAATSRE